jgi:hypothetical protein
MCGGEKIPVEEIVETEVRGCVRVNRVDHLDDLDLGELVLADQAPGPS